MSWASPATAAGVVGRPAASRRAKAAAWAGVCTPAAAARAARAAEARAGGQLHAGVGQGGEQGLRGRRRHAGLREGRGGGGGRRSWRAPGHRLGHDAEGHAVGAGVADDQAQGLAGLHGEVAGRGDDAARQGELDLARPGRR